MFGILKKVIGAAGGAAAKEVASKYKGNRDYLEAVCAVAALVAAADGEIEDSEIKATQELVSNNDALSSIYSKSDIEDIMGKYLAKAKSLSGRIALKRELADVKNNPQQAEDVFAVGVDVAMADGEMEPEEQKRLAEIAKVLGVDPKAFGL